MTHTEKKRKKKTLKPPPSFVVFSKQNLKLKSPTTQVSHNQQQQTTTMSIPIESTQPTSMDVIPKSIEETPVVDLVEEVSCFGGPFGWGMASKGVKVVGWRR